MIQTLCGLTRRLAACERGSPAVEFALLAPILIVMVMGTIDFGLAMRAKSEAEAAARAAMQKGLGNMWDTAAMTTAAQTALSADPAIQATLTLVATPSCYCDGALSASGNACTAASTCGGGGTPDYYLSIEVARTHDLLLNYFVLPQTMTLHGSMTARAQP